MTVQHRYNVFPEFETHMHAYISDAPKKSPNTCDPQSHGQLPLASIPSPAIPANGFSEGLGDPLKISHVVAPLPSVRRMCVQAAGGIVPLVGTARLLQSVIPSLDFISSNIPIPSPSTRLPLGPLPPPSTQTEAAGLSNLSCAVLLAGWLGATTDGSCDSLLSFAALQMRYKNPPYYPVGQAPCSFNETFVVQVRG